MGEKKKKGEKSWPRNLRKVGSLQAADGKQAQSTKNNVKTGSEGNIK